MKFIINKKEFLKALQRVQGIVEKRAVQPILAYILIYAEDDGIRIIATDQKLVLEGKYGATVSEEGAVCISAKMLFDIVREIDSEEICIHSKTNEVVVVEAASSLFKLIGIDPDEYPRISNIETTAGFNLKKDVLLALINKSVFAVGSDESSGYTLSGIEVQIKSSPEKIDIQFAGTDSHRLSIIRRSIDWKDGGEIDQKVIIPKKSILEIKKLLLEDDEDIYIGFGNRNVIFRKKDVSVTTRLLEGIYPRYEDVIPVNPQKKILFAKNEFERAIKRVSILTSGVTCCIEMAVETGRVMLRSENPLVGDAMESLSVEYEGNGMMIGFNYRYMLDVIAEIKNEKVLFEIQSYKDPLLVRDIEDPDFKYLLVPVVVEERGK